MTDKEIGLNDIIDLSVVELYILNYLVKIAASTVRFSVFNEINAQLSDNKISRSSFYNSLKKLESKDLVRIDANPKGTGHVVTATSLAQQAINQVNIFSIWGSVSPDTKIKALIDQRGGRYLKTQAENQLFISFDQFLHIPILDTIGSYASKNAILGTDEEFERINLQSRLNLHLSRFEGGIIREPDNYFDQVILYRYHPNALYYSHSSEEVAREAFRVLRIEGQLITIGLDEIPKTNNLILETMVSDVLEEQLPSQISADFGDVFEGSDFDMITNEVITGIRFIILRKIS